MQSTKLSKQVAVAVELHEALIRRNRYYRHLSTIARSPLPPKKKAKFEALAIQAGVKQTNAMNQFEGVARRLTNTQRAEFDEAISS